MSAISSGNLLLVRKSQLQRCRDAEMQRCGATPEQKHLFPFRTLIQKIFNTRAVKFGFHHSFFPPLPVSILYVPRMTLRKTLTDTSAKCSTKHFSPHWEIQKLMHKISHSFGQTWTSEDPEWKWGCCSTGCLRWVGSCCITKEQKESVLTAVLVLIFTSHRVNSRGCCSLCL